MKLIIGSGIGIVLLTIFVVGFFSPSYEIPCVTSFNFEYDKADYEDVQRSIKGELEKSIDGELLESIYVYSTGSPTSTSFPETIIVALKGEHQSDSAQIILIKNSLEKIPKISELGGPDITCP